MPRRRRPKKPLAVEATRHRSARRLNIPTAEHEPFVRTEDRATRSVRYPRNTDLDPQLVWRGKDEQDGSDLVVDAPPLYIQEKIRPKVLVEDLVRETKARRDARNPPPLSLFGDFNGLPEGADRTEFYRHHGNWSNRMILGDSLRVMASLAEKEGLRGKVQCIYLDPPYGIRFNSNFQWSTTSRDVKDGNARHITREPEQVKAFRDTWRDGIHTYLSYLRDRLTVARELLTESGSIFVQIGDENVHRVRALMDEVFGQENCVTQVTFVKTTSATSSYLPGTVDFLLWYTRSRERLKYRALYKDKIARGDGARAYKPVRRVSQLAAAPHDSARFVTLADLTSQSGPSRNPASPLALFGGAFGLRKGSWKSNTAGLARLSKTCRIALAGRTPRYVRFLDDHPVFGFANNWADTGVAGFTASSRAYVVETDPKVVQRCVLMATDPGDLVLDPTCGSGTTAYVAEQWGRRWITIDTSRVALALARSRIMGARYPFYTLADSAEGQQAEAKLTGREPADGPTYGDIRHGFVYERVPHITLRDIANNTEIDAIWEARQPAVEDSLSKVNEANTATPPPMPFRVTVGARKGQTVDFGSPPGSVALPSGESAPTNGLMEWEVPREPPEDWSADARAALARFWKARIARQREMDDSIARHAKTELLYDKPVVDKSKVRVAGPFTVESLAPHRTVAVEEAPAAVPRAAEAKAAYGEPAGQDPGAQADFARIVLDNLEAAGVQQTDRKDRIRFSSLSPWPGESIAAEGRYTRGSHQRRAGIFIGPEFGTVGRSHLVEAAREAAEAGFDVLISCAFAYDAQASELRKLGRVRILKARINADLHMGHELKKTGTGNLFVIFGEPDIEVEPVGDDRIRVRLKGVDVFRPQTGEIRSDDPRDIPCWFVDSDYDGESFFVRQAYFPGTTNDPYKALKTTLKAEVDREAWESLRQTVSRPFPRPPSGRIAVKVINHLGDEVMKVLRA